jgi:alkanesulfonate monooxygenase SsuD/methylene tetrahydromethanopterin reductase-like flavin-dependent oxidoreductase (luciferase family)
MEFGIFDHLDRNDLPLDRFYESRLKLAEAYEQAGFYAYHLAEHHCTPLGMAPSPSVFLAALAQRTRRLRFGPLVYALPLHHPLRLVEEICMLDHLSGGRLEIGFGRGSSPSELAFYGQDPDRAQRVYSEAMEIIIQGLSGKSINFDGQFFSFHNVPLEVQPLQKPHPPVWYGVHSVESAARAAERDWNVVSLDPASDSRRFFERFRQVWCAGEKRAAPLPKLGIGRFIVVAETDGEALSAARRAYRSWHRSFTHLFRLGGPGPAHPRPEDFDTLAKGGQGSAGSVETVARFLEAQCAQSAANYVVGQFAFGDLSLAETMRSVELFARHVMPRLRAAQSGV